MNIIISPWLFNCMFMTLFNFAGSDSGLARLVEAYREYGHLKACLDPLGMRNGSTVLLERVLNPQTFGLREDGEQVIEVEGLLYGFPGPQGSLQEVVEYLEGVHCISMALQATHISVSVVTICYSALLWHCRPHTLV